MAKRQSKVKPTWEAVKAEFVGFDRAALLAVLQDLYSVSEGNQAFLHARFSLGQNPLQPYKKTIDQWLRPDTLRGKGTSASRAKRAISDYRLASGDPEGLAELMVYYCEQAAGFCRNADYQDAAYLDALVRMFEQALRTTTDAGNSVALRARLLGRLDRVRTVGRELGYGIGDDMDVLFAEFVSSC
ncbi:MAG TPA: hypothetical protein VF753_07670 [Terriglobales bacterium]